MPTHSEQMAIEPLLKYYSRRAFLRGYHGTIIFSEVDFDFAFKI